MAKQQKTQMKISFPTGKLTAVRAFLEQKNLTIEDEFQKYFDTLFKKFVPKDVQTYIEKMHSLTETSQKNKPKKQLAEEKKSDDLEQNSVENAQPAEGEKHSQNNTQESQNDNTENYTPPLPYDRFNQN